MISFDRNPDQPLARQHFKRLQKSETIVNGTVVSITRFIHSFSCPKRDRVRFRGGPPLARPPGKEPGQDEPPL
jgi:hypothetical protein